MINRLAIKKRNRFTSASGRQICSVSKEYFACPVRDVFNLDYRLFVVFVFVFFTAEIITVFFEGIFLGGMNTTLSTTYHGVNFFVGRLFDFGFTIHQGFYQAKYQPANHNKENLL